MNIDGRVATYYVKKKWGGGFMCFVVFDIFDTNTDTVYNFLLVRLIHM